MTILESLKFVKNGYAKTELDPKLTYFVIRKQRITAFNGVIAMSAPISVELDTAPQANHFYKCIDACEDKIALTLDNKQRLKVRSGKFKAFINCLSYEEVPTIMPLGTRVDLTRPIVEKLKPLLPLVDTDNQKEFAQGLLLHKQSALATNNIVIAETWLGDDFPTVNIPRKAIQEVCRIGEEPDHLLLGENMLFFMYSDGTWIGTKLLCHDWPIETVLKLLASDGNPKPVPEALWASLRQLNKFADEASRVYFQSSQMATSKDPEETGATIECEGLPDIGIYNSKILIALEDLATDIDFSTYPKPATFRGKSTRGAFMGYSQ